MASKRKRRRPGARPRDRRPVMSRTSASTSSTSSTKLNHAWWRRFSLVQITGAIGVAAIVGAVLLLDPTSRSAPRGAEPLAPPPEAAPVKTTTVTTFCDSFSAFASVYNKQFSGGGNIAAELDAAGDEVLSVGRPPGMSDIEARGLELFVTGAVDAVRATESPSNLDGVATGSADDGLAMETFDAFLTQTCPPT